MPEALDEAYNQPIKAAFQKHLRSPDGGKAQLFDALADDFASLIEGVTSKTSVSAVQGALEDGLSSFASSAENTIRKAQAEAKNRMEQAHDAGYKAAAAKAATSVPEWTANSSVDPYKRAPFSGNIQRFVRAGIEEEVSYFQQDLKYIRKYVSEDEYARAVGQVLARGNPDVKSKLASRGIDLDDFDADDLIGDAKNIFQNTKRMGSPDIRGILEEIDPDDLATRQPQLFQRVKANGTDSLPRVMDEVAKDLAAKSPAIRAVVWTLSPRHGSIYSSPDECDFLASQDPHPSKVPAHPHPSCECQITAVTRDPSDWGSNEIDTPSTPNVDEDAVREVLEDVKGRLDVEGRTITDNYVKRVQQHINQTVSEVENNPR